MESDCLDIFDNHGTSCWMTQSMEHVQDYKDDRCKLLSITKNTKFVLIDYNHVILTNGNTMEALNIGTEGFGLTM